MQRRFLIHRVFNGKRNALTAHQAHQRPKIGTVTRAEAAVLPFAKEWRPFCTFQPHDARSIRLDKRRQRAEVAPLIQAHPRRRASYADAHPAQRPQAGEGQQHRQHLQPSAKQAPAGNSSHDKSPDNNRHYGRKPAAICSIRHEELLRAQHPIRVASAQGGYKRRQAEILRRSAGAEPTRRTDNAATCHHDTYWALSPHVPPAVAFSPAACSYGAIPCRLTRRHVMRHAIA